MSLRAAAAGGVIALALLGGAYWWGHSAADATWQARWEQRNAADERAMAAQERDARAEEQRRAREEQEREDHAEQQLQAARDEYAATAGDTERLRRQVADLRAQLGGAAVSAAAGAQLQATTRACMVLSDLYGSCVAERKELAGALDQSRLRGQGCEAQYQSLLAPRR